jgi:hypothetical protein
VDLQTAAARGPESVATPPQSGGGFIQSIEGIGNDCPRNVWRRPFGPSRTGSPIHLSVSGFKRGHHSADGPRKTRAVGRTLEPENPSEDAPPPAYPKGKTEKNHDGQIPMGKALLPIQPFVFVRLQESPSSRFDLGIDRGVF